MKKLLLLLSCLLLTLSMMAGCGGDDQQSADTSWQYIADKGELVIGLDDTFAPMGFRDEQGNLVGFDIDLANAVGEQLGVAVTFQPID